MDWDKSLNRNKLKAFIRDNTKTTGGCGKDVIKKILGVDNELDKLTKPELIIIAKHLFPTAKFKNGEVVLSKPSACNSENGGEKQRKRKRKRSAEDEAHNKEHKKRKTRDTKASEEVENDKTGSLEPNKITIGNGDGDNEVSVPNYGSAVKDSSLLISTNTTQSQTTEDLHNGKDEDVTVPTHKKEKKKKKANKKKKPKTEVKGLIISTENKADNLEFASFKEYFVKLAKERATTTSSTTTFTTTTTTSSSTTTTTSTSSTTTSTTTTSTTTEMDIILVAETVNLQTMVTRAREFARKTTNIDSLLECGFCTGAATSFACTTDRCPYTEYVLLSECSEKSFKLDKPLLRTNQHSSKYTKTSGYDLQLNRFITRRTTTASDNYFSMQCTKCKKSIRIALSPSCMGNAPFLTMDHFYHNSTCNYHNYAADDTLTRLSDLPWSLEQSRTELTSQLKARLLDNTQIEEEKEEDFSTNMHETTFRNALDKFSDGYKYLTKEHLQKVLSVFKDIFRMENIVNNHILELDKEEEETKKKQSFS